MENLRKALQGLKAFMTYKSYMNEEEGDILIDALIKAEIQPHQLTTFINELQKNIK